MLDETEKAGEVDPQDFPGLAAEYQDSFAQEESSQLCNDATAQDAAGSNIRVLETTGSTECLAQSFGQSSAHSCLSAQSDEDMDSLAGMCSRKSRTKKEDPAPAGSHEHGHPRESNGCLVCIH